MKQIVIVQSNAGMFRHQVFVAKKLLEKGFKVCVVYYGSKKENEAIEETVHDFKQYNDRFVHSRWQSKEIRENGFIKRLKAWLNFGTYYRKGHTSYHLKNRQPTLFQVPTIAKFPEALRDILGRIFTLKSFIKIANLLIYNAPIDPAITKYLQDLKPDLIIASPLVTPKSPLEAEFVRTGKQLGIKTIFYLASWDNLTTKGTLHCEPDYSFVWNTNIAKEAEEIHHVTTEQIKITGASTFDFLNRISPLQDFDAFKQLTGGKLEKPYLLFLGSSNQITGDEAIFFEKLYQALRADDELKNLHILVRPHPLNVKCWQNLNLAQVTVWPREGATPITTQNRLDLYNSIYHSIGVCGINTSALLEAAIIDKPCISIVDSCFSSTQDKIGHFQHLKSGNFMHLPNGINELLPLLKSIIRGEDALSDNRKLFVQNFLRPRSEFNEPSDAVVYEIEKILNVI